MLSSDPDNSCFWIANASVIMAARLALTSAPARHEEAFRQLSKYDGGVRGLCCPSAFPRFDVQAPDLWRKAPVHPSRIAPRVPQCSDPAVSLRQHAGID